MVNVQEKVQTYDFYSAVKARRSFYSISNEPILSDEQIQEIISEAVLHNPSPMNSQSSRVVVLLGEHHAKLWNMTKETLRKIVPAENFEPTEIVVDIVFIAVGGLITFAVSPNYKK